VRLEAKCRRSQKAVSPSDFSATSQKSVPGAQYCWSIPIGAPPGGDMMRHQLRQAKMSVVRLAYWTVVAGLILMQSAAQAYVSIRRS